MSEKASPVVKKTLLSFRAATAVVVANMVGTGVFTSLGFQVAAVPSAFGALALWVVGGIIAACGALVYAELAGAIPRSGGEYAFLGKLVHPFFGFLSGWVSSTVAFSAPMALTAMAFGKYLSVLWPGASPTVLGLTALWGVFAVHGASRDEGAKFLTSSTTIKIVPMLGLIIAAFLGGGHGRNSFAPSATNISQLWGSGFAVSLVYVSYAFSGWNASTYLAEEVEDPSRNVPRSVLLGTAGVTVLYVLLNAAFLWTVPLYDLKGVVEVGVLVGEKMFGSWGRTIMGVTIGAGLISSLSSFMMAGSRLSHALGRDWMRGAFLSSEKVHRNPRGALLIQTILASALLATSSFEPVMTYTGFTLSLFTTATVAAVFRLRAQGLPSSLRTWGYPVTPLIFLAFNGWMIFFLIRSHPWESLAGLGTLLTGAGVYLFRKKNPEEALP